MVGNDCIQIAAGGDYDARKLLYEYYFHEPPRNIQNMYRDEVLEKAAINILNAMLDIGVEGILNLIAEHTDEILPITMANIPMYSNIYDVDRIPVIVASNPGCSRHLMGYYFKKFANKEAQRKYGDTHYKAAALMGLVTGQEPFEITFIGRAYVARDAKEQDRLRACLCLKIPIIQKYLTDACKNPFDGMALLREIHTESSAVRRRSSIKQMISQIMPHLSLPVCNKIIDNISWK